MVLIEILLQVIYLQVSATGSIETDSSAPCLWHQGHCIQICPSGFEPEGDFCESRGSSVLDFKFASERFASSSIKVQNSSGFEVHGTPPYHSPTRGLFFYKSSRVVIAKKIVLSAIFSIKIWILHLNPGQIMMSQIEGLNKKFSVFSDDSKIFSAFNNHSFSDFWSPEWTRLILTFEFLPGDEVFFSFYLQHEMKRKMLLGTYEAGESELSLGSFGGLFGMAGFVYQVQVMSIILIYEEALELPECVFA